MSLEQEVELIRRFPIFSKITPAKQKLLCFSSERLTYSAGQELFRAGAVPVLIDPGIDRRALKQCLDEARPQAFIGVPMAHVGRVLLGWGRDAFPCASARNPDAAIELIRILAARLANTTAHLSRLSSPAAA